MNHLVLNALPFKQDSSGIGVMIRELFGSFTEITKQPCTVVLSKDSPDFPHNHANLCQVRSPYRHNQSFRRMWFQSFSLGRKYCRDAVFLTTDSKTPFFLPKSCRLVPLVTDLAVFRMRDAYQLSRVLWWRLQYQYVRARADLFLAISEFTKQDLMNLWHVPADKIRVVPCACPPHIHQEEDPAVLAALREQYSLPERFILFVGNSNPRKNLSRMISAFDQAKERGNLPHQLIIAGEQGWKFNRSEVLKNIRHQEDVRFIGFVPDTDMSALYSAAELFVFPTLYEGFGIPVLEAQTCGTPVLTSECTALPEIGGEGAVYADPYREEDICQKMLDILLDPDLRSRLIDSGIQNAARYSWENSANLLNEIIEGEFDS